MLPYLSSGQPANKGGTPKEDTMKKFIAACIVGLACLTTSAAPSLAHNVRITVSDNHYRGWDQRHHHPSYRQHHHRGRHWERCRTKTEKYRHHGRWVTKTTRICR